MIYSQLDRSTGDNPACDWNWRAALWFWALNLWDLTLSQVQSVRIGLNHRTPSWCHRELLGCVGKTPHTLELVIRTFLKVYVTMVILPFCASLSSYSKTVPTSQGKDWELMPGKHWISTHCMLPGTKGTELPVHPSSLQERNRQLHHCDKESSAWNTALEVLELWNSRVRWNSS